MTSPQAEAYLKLKDKQDSATLNSMTRSISDTVSSGQRRQVNEFGEIKTRLAKIEQWLEDEQAHREGGYHREEATRMKQIEANLRQLMTKMGVEPSLSTATPSEVPDGTPHRQRVRRRKKIQPASVATFLSSET